MGTGHGTPSGPDQHQLAHDLRLLNAVGGEGLRIGKVAERVGGQHGIAQAFTHQLQNGIESINFQHDAGLTLDALHLGLDQQAKGIRAAGRNQGQVGQRVEGDCGGQGFGLALAGGLPTRNQDQGLFMQQAHFQVGRRGRVVQHRQIQTPGTEAFHHQQRKALGQAELRLGHALAKFEGQGDGDQLGEAGRQANRHAPRQCTAHRLEFLTSHRHLVQYATGVLQQDPTGLGQGHAAAIAGQQGLVQLHLQLSDMAA